jgi:hypothetical protein
MTLRLVTQALVAYREDAVAIFAAEDADQVSDIGEDITREALDAFRLSSFPVRLIGKVDYKKSTYVAHPDFLVRQALFVDSKAEKATAKNTITIQTSQTSMHIRLTRRDATVDVPGKLQPVYAIPDGDALTSTVFVKYSYVESQLGGRELEGITTISLPNGMLQDRYAPDATDTIWLVGRDAPTLGEDFRARVSLSRLAAKAPWRVQRIPLDSSPYVWTE